MRQKSEIAADLERLKEILIALKTSGGNFVIDPVQKEFNQTEQEKIKKNIDTGSSSSQQVAGAFDIIYKSHLCKVEEICSNFINYAIKNEGVKQSKEMAIQRLSSLETLTSQVENFNQSVIKRNQRYVKALTSHKIKLENIRNRLMDANPKDINALNLSSKIQEIEHTKEEINNNLTALTVKAKRFRALKKFNPVVTIEAGAPDAPIATTVKKDDVTEKMRELVWEFTNGHKRQAEANLEAATEVAERAEAETGAAANYAKLAETEAEAAAQHVKPTEREVAARHAKQAETYATIAAKHAKDAEVEANLTARHAKQAETSAAATARTSAAVTARASAERAKLAASKDYKPEKDIDKHAIHISKLATETKNFANKAEVKAVDAADNAKQAMVYAADAASHANQAKATVETATNPDSKSTSVENSETEILEMQIAKPDAEIKQNPVVKTPSKKEQYRININKTYSDIEEYAQICRNLSFSEAEFDELCLDDPIIAAYYTRFEEATKACEKLVSETQKLMNSPDLKANPQDFYSIILEKSAALYTLVTDEKRSRWKLSIMERQNCLNPFPGSPERIKIEANINNYKKNRIDKLIRENSAGLLEGFHPLPDTATFERMILDSSSTDLHTLKDKVQQLEEDKKDPAYRRKTELNIEKETFLNSLRHFLEHISNIHLANGEDKNTRIFVEALTENLQEISAKLQGDNIPFNIEKVADFYQGLILQLASKKPASNLVKPDQIKQFLSDLNTARKSTLKSVFNTDSEDTILKKQAIALRPLNLTLVDFTKKTEHDYGVIKAFQDAQDPTFILQKHIQLKSYLVELERKLTAKLVLFPQKDLFTEVANAKNLIEHLKVLASNLDKEHEEYVGAMKELANQIPGLNAASAEAVQHTKLIEATQKKALDRLNTHRTTLSKHYDLVIKGLDIFYSTQKNLHIRNLQNTIEDAGITLSLVCETDDVNTRLSPARLGLDSLIKDSSTLTIENINKKATKLAEKLVGQMNNTRRILRERANNELTSLKKVIMKPQLSVANPCAGDLMRLGQELNVAIKAADVHYLTGSNISQDDVESFQAALTNANQTKQKYQHLMNIGVELEKRIQSKEYKTSMAILKALDTEFLRIFDKKTQKKLAQNNQHTTKKIEPDSESTSDSDDIDFDSEPSSESDSQEFELVNLPENKGRLFLSKNSLDKAEVNALNAIDLRLNKLWQIRKDFSEANSDYINKNTDFKELILNRMTDEFVAVFNSKLNELKAEARPIEDRILAKMVKNPSLCITERDPDVFDSYKELLNQIDPSLLDICLDIRRFDDAYQHYKPGQCYVDVLFNKIKAHLHNDQIEHISDNQNSAFSQFLRVYVFKPWRELKQWLFSDSKHHFFTTFGATKTEAILVDAGNEAAVSLEEIQAAVAARERADQEALRF